MLAQLGDGESKSEDAQSSTQSSGYQPSSAGYHSTHTTDSTTREEAEDLQQHASAVPAMRPDEAQARKQLFQVADFLDKKEPRGIWDLHSPDMTVGAEGYSRPWSITQGWLMRYAEQLRKIARNVVETGMLYSPTEQ